MLAKLQRRDRAGIVGTRPEWGGRPCLPGKRTSYWYDVGPGTPMGDVFRRYWIPALLSEEVAEPDGTPARVKLLCEDLVAFRDTSGKVGLLAENCSHRRASLFYGRDGVRTPLHLPRLEIRRGGQHHSHAGRAHREWNQAPREAPGVPLPRSERHDLDLHGSARKDAATPPDLPWITLPGGPRRRRLQVPARMQLAPVPQGRQ